MGQSVKVRLVSLHPPDLQSISVNFCTRSRNFPSISVNFCSSAEISVNVCQFLECPQVISFFLQAFVGPSINFRQLSTRPRYLLSNFRASTGPSVNFACIHGSFCERPSSFCAFAGLSVEFHQLTMHPWDLLKTLDNFPCIHGTIRQILAIICASALPSVNFQKISICPQDVLSTSVNFPCVCGYSRHISYTSLAFHATFCQHSVDPLDLSPTAINFLFIIGSFCQLLSIFCVFEGPSANFRASAGLSVNFCQLSMHLQELLSNFCASWFHSVNFCKVSLHLRDFLSISVNFLGVCCTFLQLSLSPLCHPSTFSVEGEHLSTSVKFLPVKRKVDRS